MRGNIPELRTVNINTGAKEKPLLRAERIQKEDFMNIELNKAIVRRFFDLITEGKTSGVDEIVSPDWVNNDPSLPPMRGIDGAKQLSAR